MGSTADRPDATDPEHRDPRLRPPDELGTPGPLIDTVHNMPGQQHKPPPPSSVADEGRGEAAGRPLVSEAGDSAHDEPPAAAWPNQPVAVTASGVQIPRLGLGTWQLDDDAAEQAVTAAIDIGYRHFDTAQMYGNETGVGAAIAQASVDRSQLFVTTKIDNHNHEPDALVGSVEASLERLGLEYVDLVLIHWPTHWDRIGATMAALSQVQAGGLTRLIGVSNFTVDQLNQVTGMAPLQVLQAECHPYLQQGELRRWCTDAGWAFTAYSPLAQGHVVDDEDLMAIASAHHTTAASIALAWLCSLDGVTAIPRSCDVDHLQSNWQAQFEVLDDSEMATIAQLDRGERTVDPDIAPWSSS